MYINFFFGFQINALQSIHPNTLGNITPYSILFGVHHHEITYEKFVIGKHFMYKTNYLKEQYFNITYNLKIFQMCFYQNWKFMGRDSIREKQF